jgi:hypothetical protein
LIRPAIQQENFSACHRRAASCPASRSFASRLRWLIQLAEVMVKVKAKVRNVASPPTQVP